MKLVKVKRRKMIEIYLGGSHSNGYIPFLMTDEQFKKFKNGEIVFDYVDDEFYEGTDYEEDEDFATFAEMEQWGKNDAKSGSCGIWLESYEKDEEYGFWVVTTAWHS